MQKKIFLVIFLLFLSTQLFSFLFFNYDCEYLEPRKIQAYYKEKYFEYNVYYAYYDILSGEEYFAEVSMLKGIIQNLGIRFGLLDNYIISTDFLYIFQKQEEENHNNLQSISFILEKNNNDNIGFILGLKIPAIDKKMTDNIRFLMEKDKLNILYGLFYNINYLVFINKFLIFMEIPIFFDINYKGEINAGEIFGINFYDDKEKQRIDLLLEFALNYTDYSDNYEITGVIIPQLFIKFYDDFELKIGMQIPGYAENVFWHKQDKYLYMVELNYIINNKVENKDLSQE